MAVKNQSEHEIQQMERELSRLKMELRVIQEVIHEIAGELDLNHILQLVASKAMELIQADSLLVPIINKDKTRYTYMAACGKNADMVQGHEFPINSGMCGWVLSHKQALFFGDGSQTLMDQPIAWEEGMESALLVPLMSRGKIVGGLSGLGKKGGTSFTKDDLTLLELFADHISIAIENAQIVQELVEEKERAEVTLKSIGDAVITTDAMGNVTSMNPVAENLTGWHEYEARGKLLSDIFNIFNTQTGKKAINPAQKVLENNEMTGLTTYTTLISKDDYRYQISESAAPIKNALGELLGVIMVFRDVTDEYALQVTLRDNEQRLQSILDNTPAIIYVKDIDGRYLLVNQRFENLFNTRNENIQGKTDYDIFPEEVAVDFQKSDQLVVQQREPIEIEESAPHEDGAHHYISIKFPLFDSQGDVYAICGIATDITERRQTEEALRRSQKMEAVGQLSGGIAHDFNNQLGIVIGYLDMLKNKNQGQDTQLHWIETASRATLRCMDLTRQLLSFSSKKGKDENIIDLNEYIREMDKVIERSVTPEVKVLYKLGDDLWPITSNEGEFQDIILNLVINARDAMPKGGVLQIQTHNTYLDEEQSVFMPDIKAGEYVQLTISDTGSGMDQQTQEHLFEPFFTTKPAGKGTGLGMSMVYGYVKRNNGQIKIYSETGIGSTIHIFLPRDNSLGNVVNNQLTRDDELPRGTEQILIVDDEADLLLLAETILNDLGYRTQVANNGPEAIDILQQDKDINLLFSDVVMPGGMTGYDLAKQAKEMNPQLKILLTSGFTSRNNRLDGDKSFSLMNKPYRKEILAKQIRQELDN